jgi:hypothetical protein
MSSAFVVYIALLKFEDSPRKLSNFSDIWRAYGAIMYLEAIGTRGGGKQRGPLLLV